MKKIKLTAEEREVEAEIERGEYVPVTGKELHELASALAARKKDQMLTIRVNSEDIRKIKKLAGEKGIHYQSYLAEVIHRVAMAL